jgi:hypothetical protein
MDAYTEEKKRVLQYMGACKSRVSITTYVWTSDNQKRGYMGVTAHFIDDSWNLRNIIMRLELLHCFSLYICLFFTTFTLFSLYVGSYMCLHCIQLRLYVRFYMMLWLNGI